MMGGYTAAAWPCVCMLRRYPVVADKIHPLHHVRAVHRSDRSYGYWRLDIAVIHDSLFAAFFDIVFAPMQRCNVGRIITFGSIQSSKPCTKGDVGNIMTFVSIQSFNL